MSKKIKVLADLSPDQKNHNRHTVAGMALLEQSVESVGVIEAITVSSDNQIISGNARHEVMGRKLEGALPIIVDTDGTRPVILRRTDIAGGSPEFYQASILANTTAKKNIDMDMEVLTQLGEEYDLDIKQLGVDNFVPFSGEQETEVDLSAFGKGADSYLNNAIRQIVLYYNHESHKSVLDRLAAIGAALGIQEDNSAVVIKLIEFYEQQNP